MRPPCDRALFMRDCSRPITALLSIRTRVSRTPVGGITSPPAAQPRGEEGHVLEPAYQADVVVVGAGVAGLSAAHRLSSAGVTTAVLEAAPCVGGRMATEKVDGFRLDRIGQLLSTAYPELASTPGLDALVLRPFAPGVL
ncbi:FAD-dependent oxidoreductase, partial [Streptomyces aurantiogriseus]